MYVQLLNKNDLRPASGMAFIIVFLDNEIKWDDDAYYIKILKIAQWSVKLNKRKTVVIKTKTESNIFMFVL